MSLTILINKKAPEVGIVRWFKAPKMSGGPPSGPLVRLSADEFRAKGLEVIKRYLEEDERIRIEDHDAVPVFAPGEERIYLKNCSPVSVFRDHLGQLVLAPHRFRKYALGGLSDVGPEAFRKLPWDCSVEEFWTCFDAVLAEAS